MSSRCCVGWTSGSTCSSPISARTNVGRTPSSFSALYRAAEADEGVGCGPGGPTYLMPRKIESLFVDGPAGRLEALLEEPEDGEPREAALVCHPHPQHG